MTVLKSIAATLIAIGLATAAQTQSRAPMHALPDLVGTWAGEGVFMLHDGIAAQIHEFVFEEQDGVFLRGIHKWQIPDQSIESHDGKAYVHEASEPFLGVISHEGVIHVVEHGDHTQFELQLVNRYTMDFIATEGGEHPLVGHGVLILE